MRRAMLGILLASVMVWQACTVPAWVSTAEQDAEVAVPIAASLVDVIDPALAPVVTLVEDGFSALVKTLDAFKSSPTASNLQAVQAAFEAVNGNVQQLESAAQIKNATTQTTVTSVVALLTQAVTEIAAQVPPAPALSGTVPAAQTAAIQNAQIQNSRVVKHWKAKDFKRAYNNIAKHDKRLRKL
jgi:soluble cytochrome b562